MADVKSNLTRVVVVGKGNLKHADFTVDFNSKSGRTRVIKCFGWAGHKGLSVVMQNLNDPKIEISDLNKLLNSELREHVKEE